LFRLEISQLRFSAQTQGARPFGRESLAFDRHFLKREEILQKELRRGNRFRLCHGPKFRYRRLINEVRSDQRHGFRLSNE
jgi:hypothetical protein